jgi:sulfide:quinone oxidoreductase
MAAAKKPHVVVAGGGVAAIEALLALRDLAGDRVSIELVAPQSEFSYRPLSVSAAFDIGDAPRYDLGAITQDLRATHHRGAIVAVQAERHVAWTASGEEIPYDTLVLATGAEPEEAVPGALTFRGPESVPEFRALLDELDRGGVRTVAFAAPAGTSWALPIYELAFMTAARLRAKGAGTNVKIVTGEDAPLNLFGRAASDVVAGMLAERGIEVLTSTHPAKFSGGTLTVVPAGEVAADRVVALPRLTGRRIEGVPHDSQGFIEVGPLGDVTGLEDVYAAGDSTAGSIKQGGVATQQADTVAAAVAAHVGAPVSPAPFRPVLRGTLLTGDGAQHMRSEVTGGAGDRSDVSAEILWWPTGKIAGRHLSDYLASRAQPIEPEQPLPADAIPVDVQLSDGSS